MNYKKTVFLGLSALIPGILSAFDEPGNILKDFELKSPEVWNCKIPVERNVIESFEGLAEPLYYLSGKSGGVLSQTVNVKPNTWYTMQFLFRAHGKYASDPTYKYNLLAGFLPEGESNFWKGKETRTFGGSPVWNRGRIFFNSGSNKTVTPFLYFIGRGAWDIGRIYLRETAPADFQNNICLDSGFETCKRGMIPTEFRQTGRGQVSGITVSSQTAYSGKQALEAEFIDRFSLVGGRFPAKAGDRFKAGIYLKASAPVMAELVVSGTGVKPGTRRTRKIEIGKEWKHLSLDGIVRTAEGSICPLQIHLNFQAKDKGNKVTVWADDVSFTVQTVEEAKLYGTRSGIWNDSFETGPYGWRMFFDEDPRFSNAQTRGIFLDALTAGHGKYSLRIQKSEMPAVLRKKNLFNMRSMPLHIDNQEEYVFSFMAKADKPTTLSVAFPYKSIGNFRVTDSWQRFYSTPVKPGRWYHNPNYNEIRITSPLDGTVVWLDAFMLEKRKGSPFQPYSEFETGIFFPDTYKIFPENGKRDIQLMAASHRKAIAGNLELKISDLFDNTVLRETKPVSLAPGNPVHISRQIGMDRPGYFRAEITLKDRNGKKLAENITTYAVLAPPRKIPYGKSWCGILSGLDESGRNGSNFAAVRLHGSSSLDDTLDILQLIGYKWIRIMGIGNWRNTEPVRGSYEWKWDSFVDTIKKHDMGILAEFLSHDAQPWSNSGVIVKEKLQGGFHYTAKAEDVARFSSDFARRYRHRIDSINLMNETNGYPPEEYLKIIKAVYRTFKKEAPEIIVQGPGYPSNTLPLLENEGKDNTWITKALKLGLNDFNDVMGIHPYDTGHAHTLGHVSQDCAELRLTGNNRTFAEQRRLQVQKFKKEFKNNRIWDSESGAIFNTLPKWMNSPAEIRFPWYSERVAASRMIRWNILRMAMGIERHFHFMFLSESAGYHTLDIVNMDGTPRAGVAPLSTFYRLFDGSRFIGSRKIDGTHIYVFQDYDGHAVAACWNPLLENKDPGALIIPDGFKITEVLNFTENPVKGKNGTWPLNDTPLYLKSALPPEVLLEKLTKAKFLTESYQSALAVVSDAGSMFAEASVVNNGNMPIRQIEVEVGKSRETITDLSPRNSRTIRFPLKLVSEKELNLEATFRHGKDKQRLRLQKRVFYMAKSQGNETSDGNIGLNEYPAKWSGEFLRYGKNAAYSISAELSASWTPDKLRFAVEVKDPTPRTASGNEPVHLGDGIELYLDFAPGRNPYSPRYPDEAVRLSVNPAFPEKPVFERNGIPAKNNHPFFDFSKVGIASKRFRGGYSVELEIPLKKQITAGQLLGFNCCIMDHGNTPTPNQGLTLSQSPCWNNVNYFELLVLR